MKLLIITLSFLLFNTMAIGQDFNKVDSLRTALTKKAESYILEKKSDSAIYYLDQSSKPNKYNSILKQIAESKKVPYEDYKKFINKVSVRSDVNYLKVSDFINANIVPRDLGKQPDEIYAFIKINQISRLRNDGLLDLANTINEKLDAYLRGFDPELESVRILTAHFRFHESVLLDIQNDLEASKEIIYENFEIADQYNEPLLRIAGSYYLSSILVKEGKLEEFIATNEASLKLEMELENRSPFYSATIVNLVDAYVYKGASADRILELLEILYSDADIRPQSYSLYAKFLGTLEKDSKVFNSIMNRFNTNNVIEFAQSTKKQAKDILNLNDYYQLVRECANMLEKHGYLKEAIAYQKEAVFVTREVYSQDLAQSLSTFKTEQATKVKDIEIANEKKRSTLFIIASIIVAGLLAITLFFFKRSYTQSRTLIKKNAIIDKTLKEKELLVKEIHHRVKNNFQIVSSLLELQSKDIKDEKAKQLADEGKNRVKSMAIIHQKLYQNESGRIDMNDYVKDLIREITSLSQLDKKVTVTTDINDIMLDVDTAIPLGLILNELVTNAYKYAFAKAESPQLFIGLSEDKDFYKLEVKDNGPEREKPFEITTSKTLGTRLVRRLTKQLQGKLYLDTSKGFQYTIHFKDTYQRKEID